MKTDRFSGQAWRGYDCAATCLLLIIRPQNLSITAALKSIIHTMIAIIFALLTMAYSALKSLFDVE
ncbi:hypothetical protein P2E05_12380 [Providencia stuartii]|uniref:hypothetical protein n=1 Tax=Providencia stuartii TaxID=588 RepID=UPI0023E24119|nr:hypothetical protein [Providencia stuartii]ELR5143330.1 hypothetical protein [Providencia stuartii]WER20905.1 hypothetical protein P2E04_12375 [Providencia stuartii]WER25025.1 hypothetical protein P2E05_12380 [Providencia stuartii]WER29115.1 hypothetical protein P2E06_12380 [Providencia stuartii]